MTEVQAAIGRCQLRRLPEWLSARRRNAALLAERLRSLPLLRVPEPPPHVGHAWYKFYAFVRPDRLASGWTPDRIMAAIARAGSPALPARARRSTGSGRSRTALWDRRARSRWRVSSGETSLMFLVHPTLAPEDMDEACRVVEEVCTLATR